ncbi:MAG: TrkH family potassium uptake protein [bacterium]
MRPTVVSRYVGLILLIGAAGMLTSALVGWIMDGRATAILSISAILVACFGAFPMVFVPRVEELTPRESLATVALGWISMSFAGILPYLLYGAPFTFINALFESVSGFTTTGASILGNIQVLPAGILFWRSMTHWIGGVGIIVLALAIFPSLSTVGHSLMRAEISPVALGPKVARAREIARVVLFVYVGLTLLETIALMAAGLSLYDASTTSFGTIATGGFSVRDGSIAFYHSVTVEIVVTIFMILAGMNFALLYGLVITKGRPRGGTTTAFAYLSMLAIGMLMVTLDLKERMGIDWTDSLRYGAFQVASIGTSSGFASANTSIWPGGSQAMLMLLALICASAGSTSGGIKVDRIVLFAKLVRARLYTLGHPEGIAPIRLEGRRIPEETARDAMFFVVAYLAGVLVAALAVAFTGVPLVESASGTIACMGNVGPGLGTVGSMGNYGALPGLAKLLLAGVMITGRLEIFPILLLASRRFWR